MLSKEKTPKSVLVALLFLGVVAALAVTANLVMFGIDWKTPNMFLAPFIIALPLAIACYRLDRAKQTKRFRAI